MPRFKLLPLCWLFVLAPAAAGPAGGICMPIGTAFLEAEVVSCGPARQRFDEVAAREMASAMATKARAEASAAEMIAKGMSVGLSLQRRASLIPQGVAERCKVMAPVADGMALLVVSLLRYKVVPYDLQPGDWVRWLAPRPETPREFLLPATFTCADLPPGHRVTIEPQGSCCDFFPTQDLDCFLNLPIARPRKAKDVAAEEAEARIRSVVREEKQVRRGFPRHWGTEESVQPGWRRR